MIIYIQYTYHEVPYIVYLVIDEDGKNSLIFRQTKGNYSSITNDILMKFHMHNHTLVIFVLYKFNESTSISYLVIVEERINH